MLQVNHKSRLARMLAKESGAATFPLLLELLELLELDLLPSSLPLPLPSSSLLLRVRSCTTAPDTLCFFLQFSLWSSIPPTSLLSPTQQPDS